jgi:hypothetical protein
MLKLQNALLLLMLEAIQRTSFHLNLKRSTQNLQLNPQQRPADYPIFRGFNGHLSDMRKRLSLSQSEWHLPSPAFSKYSSITGAEWHRHDRGERYL